MSATKNECNRGSPSIYRPEANPWISKRSSDLDYKGVFALIKIGFLQSSFYEVMWSSLLSVVDWLQNVSNTIGFIYPVRFLMLLGSRATQRQPQKGFSRTCVAFKWTFTYIIIPTTASLVSLIVCYNFAFDKRLSTITYMVCQIYRWVFQVQVMASYELSVIYNYIYNSIFSVCHYKSNVHPSLPDKTQDWLQALFSGRKKYWFPLFLLISSYNHAIYKCYVLLVWIVTEYLLFFDGAGRVLNSLLIWSPVLFKCLACWVKKSANAIPKYFSYFSWKTDFDNLHRMSKSVFWEK